MRDKGLQHYRCFSSYRSSFVHAPARTKYRKLSRQSATPLFDTSIEPLTYVVPAHEMAHLTHFRAFRNSLGHFLPLMITHAISKGIASKSEKLRGNHGLTLLRLAHLST